MKLFILILLSAFNLQAATKRVSIDTEKSTITWKGWKLVKTMDNHIGTVGLGKSFLLLDGDKIVGGTLTVDLTKIENTDQKDPKYRAKLLDHLKSDDFFDVKNHSEATYEITSTKKLKKNQQEFTGTLTIKGKPQKDAKIIADVSKEGDILSAKGKMTFDRSKFDVKYNSQTFFPNLLKTAKEKVISNDIELTFDLKTAAN